MIMFDEPDRLPAEELDACEMTDVIRKRIESCEWWIIPIASEASYRYLRMLENKFCNEGREDHMDLLSIEHDDDNMTGIAMVKKINMLSDEVEDVFKIQLNQMGYMPSILMTWDISQEYCDWFKTTFIEGN